MGWPRFSEGPHTQLHILPIIQVPGALLLLHECTPAHFVLSPHFTRVGACLVAQLCLTLQLLRL